MPATTLDPRRQIRDALQFVRRYQHHDGCRCGTYRNTRGEAFCSSGHATWNRAIDALIEQCRAT